MRIHRSNMESLPLCLLSPHPLNVFAAIAKARHAAVVERDNQISYWQLVFLQSRANGCFHHFEDLPQVRWQWPRDTWFQARKSQKLNDNFTAQRLNN